MPAILLQIKWKSSKEYIPLDLSTLPMSATIETYEDWGDGQERTVYRARCEAMHVDEGYNVRLVYSYEDNAALVDAHGVDLGTTTIHLTPDLETARATWAGVTDPVGTKPAQRPCKVIDTLADEAERTIQRYATDVIARPGQALLRRTLLLVDRCCALTGEAMPMVLDAAHITAVANGGGDVYSNAILLRTDLHRLYDGGAFTLDENGLAHAEQSLSTYYKELLKNVQLCERVLARVQSNLRRRNSVAKIDAVEGARASDR